MTAARSHIRLVITGMSLVLLTATLAACGSDSDSSATPAKRAKCATDVPREISDSFPTPDVRRSKNGVLETTMRASYEAVELAGKQYKTMAYDGSVPGPTLVVCPGDTLIVHLKNDLGDTPTTWLAGMPTGHDMDAGHGQLSNLLCRLYRANDCGRRTRRTIDRDRLALSLRPHPNRQMR